MSESVYSEMVYMVQNQQSKKRKQKLAVFRGVRMCQNTAWEERGKRCDGYL